MTEAFKKRCRSFTGTKKGGTHMAELKVYTMEEVSEILSISIKTVYKYIKEGSLPAVRVGKYWRITEDGLKGVPNKRDITSKERTQER